MSGLGCTVINSDLHFLSVRAANRGGRSSNTGPSSRVAILQLRDQVGLFSQLHWRKKQLEFLTPHSPITLTLLSANCQNKRQQKGRVVERTKEQDWHQQQSPSLRTSWGSHLADSTLGLVYNAFSPASSVHASNEKREEEEEQFLRLPIRSDAVWALGEQRQQWQWWGEGEPHTGKGYKGIFPVGTPSGVGIATRGASKVKNMAAVSFLLQNSCRGLLLWQFRLTRNREWGREWVRKTQVENQRECWRIGGNIV